MALDAAAAPDAAAPDAGDDAAPPDAPPVGADLLLPLAGIVRAAAPSLGGASLSKSAKGALQRAAAVFVLCVTSAAADGARAARRVTVSDRDVLAALDGLGLADFAGLLRAQLAVKKAAGRAKSASAKRAKLAGADADAHE